MKYLGTWILKNEGLGLAYTYLALKLMSKIKLFAIVGLTS